VLHVDATVVTEQPKIGPHREAIRASLAGVLGLKTEHVNVKATRGEGMGWIGRGEGAAALATATVEWGYATAIAPPPPSPSPSRDVGRRGRR
jgi:2-C-methyl-D-erythritol 2,4-cyclodiphosphate synthase